MLVFVVLAGLSVASFLGSLSYRASRHISIVTPPSYCPNCGTQLKPYDLIPVISYIILRARCRYCRHGIPLQYFIVEIITPLLYAGLYKSFGITPLFFSYAYLITVLLYLSLLDIDTGLISYYDTGAVYAGSGMFLYLAARGAAPHSVLTSFYGFAASLILLLASTLVVFSLKKRQPVGLGDIFIIPGVALYFGVWEVIRILIFSSLIGLCGAVVLIITHRVKGDCKFPFLPCYAAGVCIEILLF